MVKIHLSRLLGEKRWTQKDLADATGIRPSTINEWYHELVPRLNVDHIDKICEALDCTITDLLEYIPNERKTTGKYLILEEHGNRKQKKKKPMMSFTRPSGVAASRHPDSMNWPVWMQKREDSQRLWSM